MLIEYSIINSLSDVKTLSRRYKGKNILLSFGIINNYLLDRCNTYIYLLSL